MKRVLAFVLCALFALHAAEARTIYVNARRPNNKGNGLKVKSAKKTIQAAINIARKGDTILVYPGTYAPIRTNNKKITIKSVKGASRTSIVMPAKTEKQIVIAQLGKTYTYKYGNTSYSSDPLAKGKSTTLIGFLLDGLNRDDGGSYEHVRGGVSGGTVKSCSIQRLGRPDYSSYYTQYAASDADLTGCTVMHNRGAVAYSCTLNRCRIADNSNGGRESEAGAFYNSRLFNCLIAGNRYGGSPGWTPSHFNSSTLINCTIVENGTLNREKLKFSIKSKFYNCILWNNYTQEDEVWDGDQQDFVPGPRTIHNVDSGNTYSRTYQDNRDPKFVSAAKGNYKLKKGSYAIDKGKLTKAQKKLVGTKDLAGRKRIRGKAIDLGCYEY